MGTNSSRTGQRHSPATRNASKAGPIVDRDSQRTVAVFAKCQVPAPRSRVAFGDRF